jgi:nitrite reductase/ring-hydroxylating ferredoxin subunit
LAFQKAAALAEIPAHRGLAVALGALELALFRVGDAVYAIENACPHAGFPLAEGELEGAVVICCAHGWEFDLATGGSPHDPRTPLIRRFAVRIDGADVWVDPEAAAAP